jgi:hypothetical protein
MVTSCDPINPYTQSDTFGVAYNGGYKPDKTLEWIPADTNMITDYDDFLPPPILPPPNMLMQTCEGRKIDPRVGTVTKREMEFDDFTESQEVAPIVIDTKNAPVPVKEGLALSDELQWSILIFVALLLFVLLSVTKFS